MTIKKFTGKTREEAVEAAKTELGDSVVIMNVKEVRPKGLLGFFKSSTYEVTAAIEDEVMMRTSGMGPVSEPHREANFRAVADEKIVIPPAGSQTADAALRDAFQAVNEVIGQQETQTMQTSPVRKATEVYAGENRAEDFRENRKLEQRLETLQSLLEKQFSGEPSVSGEQLKNQNKTFIKMIYNVLLENEVDEKYINQILEDMEKVMRGSASLDYLLSNVYQKMVLKLGQPNTISLGSELPKVIFFIGPTGVGKTTTIAKIASKYKVEHGKKIALLTADTYRIAAAEQLRTYASILNIPLSIIYAPQELEGAVKQMSDCDLILIDTAGFSHKNEEQRQVTEDLLHELDDSYAKEVYLVLSATTKYNDLRNIVDIYKGFTDFHLIFTKLDETAAYGNIMNICLYADAPLSYVTMGQNVPDDIAIVDPQKIVKQLLGGH